MSFGGPISHAKVPVNISRLETLIKKVVHSIQQVPSIKGSCSPEHIKFQAIPDSMCIKFQVILSQNTVQVIFASLSYHNRHFGVGDIFL